MSQSMFSKNKQLIITSLVIALLVAHILWLDAKNFQTSKKVDSLISQLQSAQAANNRQTERLNHLEEQLAAITEKAKPKYNPLSE